MNDDKVQADSLQPLGIYSHKAKVYLLSKKSSKTSKSSLHLDTSSDGFNFYKEKNSPVILNSEKKHARLQNVSDFRVSKINDFLYLTYKNKIQGHTILFAAQSKNHFQWKLKKQFFLIDETAVIAPDYKYQGERVMYFGDKSIRIAYSSDMKSWKRETKPLLDREENYYGLSRLIVGNVFLLNEGILLLYFSGISSKTHDRYYLHSALFDRENPAKIIKKTKDPIWESTEKWGNKHIYPIGIVSHKDNLLSYWQVEGKGVGVVIHPFIKRKVLKKAKKGRKKHLLKKFKHNPIIKPIVEHFWESKATFNTAALYEKGKVHMLYRAIGEKDVSVIGYASSRDGANVDYRHKEPVYEPREPFESGVPEGTKPTISPFVSGGGCYGGCEDPRLTKIKDKIYMTYVAYDGRSHPRVALTSIKADDFFNHDWNWEKPVLISRPGVVNKNCVVFPEKIKGKYVIYHRVYPNILIDYVDSLEFDGETKFLEGQYKINPNKYSWDSRKVGAGPPPLKTDEGWLLIYHAVGDQDPTRYKIGAMLLDHDDPTRVLFRTKNPIVEPTHWYENDGHKAGVAYPCGAVIMDDDLHVYYGGADTVVCGATAKLSHFLDYLKSPGNEEPSPLMFH